MQTSHTVADEVIGDLHDVQHGSESVIDTASHVHQNEWCLETIFCRGDIGT